MASLVGKTLLNQFRVEEFIDSGGMGVVYRVWDKKRNVPMAMKVLHADLAEDPSILRKFKREANALKKLAHPNIVPFYGMYQTMDFAFLIERFIDGPSLKEILAKNKGRSLPISHTLTVLKAVCSALGFAHSYGVVHCDVKPGNVMVEHDGHIFLTDFGIARHADSTTTTLAYAGAPAYMAPEQIKGQPVNASTDVYALGILLFEMITGRRPFRGDERGTEKGGATAGERLRYAHLHIPPPDPRTLNPQIPERLTYVVLKALAKEQRNRYQSVQAFLKEASFAAGMDSNSIPDRLRLKGLVGSRGDREIPPIPLTHTPFDWRIPAYIAGGIAAIALLIWLFSSTGKSSVTFQAPTALQADVGIMPTQPANTVSSADEPAEESASVSNDPQGKIVFTCQVDRETNHDQICIMNADGSGWRQLTNELFHEHFYSSLSPDGRTIVFSSSRNGGFEIFEMNVDGSNLQQLTSGIGECYAPEISPDGSKIAFTRHVGGKNYISTINRSGGNLRDINDYHDCKDPTWSPDGNEILFAANPNRTTIQFYVMSTNGGNVRKLTDIDGLRGRSDWSVDGQMASYAGQYQNQNRELFLFSKNQSSQFITDGGDNLAPSFSPDGKWIVFMSYRDHFWDSDGCEIYIMRLEDSYVKRLTDNNYCDWQPRWGP